MLGQQWRGRSIAMGKPELDACLTVQQTCRVATAGQDGPAPDDGLVNRCSPCSRSIVLAGA